MKSLVPIFVTVMTGLMICYIPLTTESKRYRLDDPELAPFSSMYEVDREQFCLTDIDEDAGVEIERDEYATSGYHIMLHMYSGNIVRHIAFVREANRYSWIGEQEIHNSGRKFETIDGEDEEHISITYHKRKYNSYDSIGLDIHYSGDYKYVDFSRPFDLTCKDVKPYIEEWGKQGKVFTDN